MICTFAERCYNITTPAFGKKYFGYNFFRYIYCWKYVIELTHPFFEPGFTNTSMH